MMTVHTNGTGAMRDNAGKAPLSYILEFPNAIKGVSQVMDFGATIRGYERGNWKKGLDPKSVMDSFLRHATSYINGDLLDVNPETGEADEKFSGLPHVYLMLANALFMAEFYEMYPETRPTKFISSPPPPTPVVPPPPPPPPPIKEGDLVRVVRKIDKWPGNGWVRGMDQQLGKVNKVRSVGDAGVNFHNRDYGYPPAGLELITDANRFKIGDEVVSTEYGVGKIIGDDGMDQYPILVQFDVPAHDDDDQDWYTRDGRRYRQHRVADIKHKCESE